jgi:hypothetical protein
MGWLLLLSVPIFYIVGLVAFISWIIGLSSKNKVNRRKYLETAVEELSQVIAKKPDKTLIQQFEAYKTELASLRRAETVVMPEAAKATPTESPPAPAPIAVKEEKTLPPKIIEEKPGPSLQEEWSQFWTNWYSDNSINLLLYLGAFLIVASASIYVGFQWETIGGVSKAALLSLLTLTFFGFGTWFYNVPKIRQAGATFIAIAALLIPFNGLAWYNFVLEPAGYSIGSVWLTTSIIAVVAYSALAYAIRHPFYTYIAGFGGLSMILAIVNTADLNREFYILGGIFSSFVLLLSTRLFNQSKGDELKNYITPLTISAHVVMPISLVFGLLLAAESGKLFSFEVVTSAFLASLYYFVAYSFVREVGYLFASLLILPISIFLFGKWIALPDVQIFIITEVLAFIYLIVSPLVKETFKKEYEALTLTSHLIIPVSLFLTFASAAALTNFFVVELVLSSLLAALFYFVAYFVSKESNYLMISQFVLALTVFLGGKWLALTTIQIVVLIEILCVLYISASYFVRNLKNEFDAMVLASNSILPVVLLWLVFYASSTGTFFTSGVVLASVIGSGFYSLCYLIKRNPVFLVVSTALLPISVFLFGKWIALTTLQAYYLVEIVLALFLALSYPLKAWGKEDSESLTVVTLAYAAAIFFIALGTDVVAFHLTVFAALPAVYGLVATYLQQNSNYLYYNIIFVLIAVYLYFNELLGLGDRSYFVGSAYLGLTVIFYLIALAAKNTEGGFRAFVFATSASAVLGFAFTMLEPAYFLIGNIIVAAIFLDYAIRFNRRDLIYISNLFLYLGLWSLLRSFDARLMYYPLFFAGFSYIFYIVSQSLPEAFRNFYRLTALIGSGATTVVFGALSQTDSGGYYSTSQGRYIYDNTYADLERTALISSYAATFLYSIDAALVKKATLGYFASAVGMFTYLWQIKFLGVTETQVYTLPLGVYFMVLAYFQRISGNLANRDLLNYVGLGFLFVPTFFQSFSDAGAQYALLMGVEGLIVFALGTSLSYRTFIFTGIAAVVVAVISQTYEFVFSLPRWMITATAGIILLSTAIYLLLHRKEEHQGK